MLHYKLSQDDSYKKYFNFLLLGNSIYTYVYVYIYMKDANK